MSNYKKRFDRDNISDETKKIIEKTDKRLLENSMGIAGDNLHEAIPQYINADCETVISGKNGSSIILGRDRSASRLSGTGGRGDTNCASIDLVVGRGGANTPAVNEENEQLWIDPDFEKDAARIYVSQKADIDSYFDISDENPTNTRSAIGIKADQVRIVAREKIKLVTGTDSRNSQGAEIRQSEGVEIISGNDATKLQSMVLGENLAKQQSEIVNLIDSLAGIVDAFLMTQFQFDQIASGHFHISPFFCVPTTPSETMIPAGQQHCLNLLTKVKKSLLNLKINLATHKINYLEPIGSDYVCSRKNKVN